MIFILTNKMTSYYGHLSCSIVGKQCGGQSIEILPDLPGAKVIPVAGNLDCEFGNTSGTKRRSW